MWGHISSQHEDDIRTCGSACNHMFTQESILDQQWDNFNSRIAAPHVSSSNRMRMRTKQKLYCESIEAMPITTLCGHCGLMSWCWHSLVLALAPRSSCTFPFCLLFSVPVPPSAARATHPLLPMMLPGSPAPTLTHTTFPPVFTQQEQACALRGIELIEVF